MISIKLSASAMAQDNQAMGDAIIRLGETIRSGLNVCPKGVISTGKAIVQYDLTKEVEITS